MFNVEKHVRKQILFRLKIVVLNEFETDLVVFYTYDIYYLFCKFR